MIEYYTVFDEFAHNPHPIGVLAYEPSVDKYSMFIDTTLIDPRMYPILFGLNGSNHPTDHTIRNWIESRTTPPDRVGIGDILKALNLDEYNGWEILKAANGRNPGYDRWGFVKTDNPNSEFVNKLTWD